MTGVRNERLDAVAARLADRRLLPIAELADESAAVPLAEGLIAAGLPCLEITLRTDAAPAALRAVRAAYPELLLGAGTVISPADVEVAADCGVDFAISPGLSPAVVHEARGLELPIIPGVCTPSDLQAAIELGIDTVKFFPAEASGGVAALRALSGPFGDMRFVPTGGITPGDIDAYLALEQVIACGGSWLVDPDAVRRVTGVR